MNELKSLIEIQSDKIILNSIAKEKLRMKLAKIERALPMLSPRAS